MIPIHLASFKAAGIYRVVFDKSTVLNTDAEIMRLVVGYSEKGPFNTPTYVSSTADFKAIYGDISKKLEKRGVFFHRTALQCLTEGPILCLNLKKFDGETVGASDINTDFNESEPITAYSVKVEDLYDTTRFWVLDATKLQEIRSFNGTYGKKLENYITIAATDAEKTSRSYFIRKASGRKVNGYNITVSDWYKDSNEEIPEYLQDKLNNLMSDFMAEIYVFDGKFTAEQVASSETLKNYFNIATMSLKPYVLDAFGDPTDTLDALYNDPSSGAISHYVGSLIPYFKDKEGVYQSLDIKFNDDVEINCLMMNFNTDILEDGKEGEPVTIDISGRHIITSSESDPMGVGKLFKHEGKTTLLGNKTAPVVVDVYEKKDNSLVVDAASLKANEFAVYNTSVSFLPTKATVDVSNKDKFVLKAPEAELIELLSEGDCFLSETTVTAAYALDMGDEEMISTYAAGQVYENVYFKGFVYDEGGQITGAEFNGKPLLHDSSSTKYLVRVDNPLNQEIGDMKPVYLKGYEFKSIKPESTSMLHKLNWHNKILSALTDYKGLRIGLLNKSEIDYRYIIDSFESYVTPGCKNVLSFLAKEKQSAFAILNFPSVKTFIKCPYASFTDTAGVFNVDYIVKGCNPKKAHSMGFSLPSDSEGASFCAFYTPLKFSDGYIDSIRPAAGLVSNLFMEKYKSRQPYYIIAGPNYGVISASGLIGPDYKYSMDELQIIEPYGVNCMVYRPNFGTFINANQTAKQSPRSALSSVNVRELVIYLQDEIEKLLQSYQWEFNNQVVRNKIKDRADAICTRVKQNGGIIDFLNVMDESNNTPEIIDNEMAILSTHIEPGRGMGKMVHELTIYRTGQMKSSIAAE